MYKTLSALANKLATVTWGLDTQVGRLQHYLAKKVCAQHGHERHDFTRDDYCTDCALNQVTRDFAICRRCNKDLSAPENQGDALCGECDRPRAN